MGCSFTSAVRTNNTKFREARNIHLFIAGYGLYFLYLHTTARGVAVQPYNVTRKFLRNSYDIEHM